MTDRELMQQAHRKLKAALVCHPNAVLTLVEEAFDALDARLAQPEPKPVAWMEPNGFCATYKHGTYQIPLYPAPPQREWQGLTDEEIEQCADDDGSDDYGFARAIERAIKEKNT